MKKAILLGALCALSLASCVKDDDQFVTTKPTTTCVSFGWQFASQGKAMTRTELTNQDIQNAISVLQPSKTDIDAMEFALTSLNGNGTQNCKFGKTYNLHCDTYRAQYSYQRNGFARTQYNLLQYSSFVIDDTLAVVPEVTQYQLNAQYDCFALCYDKTTTSVKIDGTETENSVLAGIGFQTNVLFIEPKCTDWQISLDIAPAIETDGTPVSITITADDVQNGYYYLLEPKADFVMAGFSLNLPAFKRGIIGE